MSPECQNKKNSGSRSRRRWTCTYLNVNNIGFNTLPCYQPKWHFSVQVPTFLMLVHKRTNLDWSGQNTIYGHDLWCIILKLALYIFIMSLGLHTRLYALQLMCHMPVFALQPAYTCIHELPLNNSRIIRKLPILILAYTLIQISKI